MNKLETARLLTAASGFDRFMRADELTTTAWQMALRDVPYELAETALVAHYSGDNAHKQLMPADILRAVSREARLLPFQVEADVRSAKARGLVAASWPRGEVLSADVRARLGELRDVVRDDLLVGAESITADEFARMEREL